MKTRAQRLTEIVKRYDSKLYVDTIPSGALAVFRRTSRFISYDIDGDTVAFELPSPYLVFSLTENWSAAGKAVDWGIEVILARLKAIDLWNNDRQAEELLKSYEKADAGRKKDRRNNTEAFLYDFRRQFAKAFDGVNTSNLDRTDKRKLTDKRIKE